MYTNKYIAKYFEFLSGINRKMLASLKNRKFYHHLLKPQSQNQTTTVMFFKRCAPNLLLSRKLILAFEQADVGAKKLNFKANSVEILMNHRLNFYLDDCKTFLCSFN